MCQASNGAAAPQAAGRYGDLRIRSKSSSRACWPREFRWLPQSRSVRSFRPFGALPSHTSVTDAGLRSGAYVSCRRHPCRIAVRSEPTRIVTSPTTISITAPGVSGGASAFCFCRKASRQLNSWGGEIPKRHAIAKTFTPGSSAAAMACALNSSDYRRHAPSNRSITASTNCKLPVAGIGVELVVDIEPRRQTNARSLSRIDKAIKLSGQLPAYEAQSRR